MMVFIQVNVKDGSAYRENSYICPAL